MTATNKSEIAKLRMYQFVIFRSAGFLEMATITNTFPTIAVLFMMINRNGSTITEGRLRFEMVELTDVPTVIVLICKDKLPSFEITEEYKSIIFFPSFLSFLLVSIGSANVFCFFV